jgi:hypothetical protein
MMEVITGKVVVRYISMYFRMKKTGVSGVISYHRGSLKNLTLGLKKNGGEQFFMKLGIFPTLICSKTRHVPHL